MAHAVLTPTTGLAQLVVVLKTFRAVEVGARDVDEVIKQVIILSTVPDSGR